MSDCPDVQTNVHTDPSYYKRDSELAMKVSVNYAQIEFI